MTLMHTINSVFEAQQKYKYTLRNSNATQRIEKLNALKRCILQFEKEIYEALQHDLRKCRFEAAVTELLFILSEIDFAIKNVADWMQPKRAGKTVSNLLAKNRIYQEPKGVCLIITPWNYPFQLLMSPLISAIAAGNCVILKPSELSSETSSIIARIVEDCFEEQEIACFEGDAEIATALLSLPFDHIFFTGSTQIGKVVMTAAAKNLSSVTLELGGKSPVIIDETANLQQAAEKIAWGKLINAGQTCIAPDYILIQQHRQEEFIKHYKSAAERMFFTKEKVADPHSYAKIINLHHFNRLNKLLDDALQKGAEVPFGGPHLAGTLSISPTVLTGLTPDADIMQEEIFGPILPILNYEHLDDAIQTINNKSKPLALYIFSEHKKNIRKIIRNTSSGGTCVNDVLIHISNPKLPFGGVNGSGMGSCHGIFGFKTFSHERAVVFQSKINATRIIYPPYSGKNWVLRLLEKIM